MSCENLDDGAPALEPRLTADDKRVLKLLPHWRPVDGLRAAGVTKWMVAERLGTEDVQAVREQLDGLEHLHYAFRSLRTHVKPQRYWLTDKGADALADLPVRKTEQRSLMDTVTSSSADQVAAEVEAPTTNHTENT